MPTLAMYKGERSLDELTARLFPGAGGGQQASKQAAEALLKANPQLADLGRLPSGSVIVVPDTPVAASGSETVSHPTLASAGSAASVSEHLSAFASALAAQSASAAAQADSTLKLLQDPSLTAAAARDSVLAQRLTAISDTTKADLKEVQEKQAMLQQAIAQMQQDVAKLLKSSMPPSLEPPPPPPLRAPPSGSPAASPRNGRNTNSR